MGPNISDSFPLSGSTRAASINPTSLLHPSCSNKLLHAVGMLRAIANALAPEAIHGAPDMLLLAADCWLC
jgi:hypothetical protein